MLQGQLRNRSTADEMNRGVGMLESRVSQRCVAAVFNVSDSVVSRICNCHLTNGNALHIYGGGLEKNRTQHQGHSLLIQAQRGRFQNASSP